MLYTADWKETSKLIVKSHCKDDKVIEVYIKDGKINVVTEPKV